MSFEKFVDIANKFNHKMDENALEELYDYAQGFGYESCLEENGAYDDGYEEGRVDGYESCLVENGTYDDGYAEGLVDGAKYGSEFYEEDLFIDMLGLVEKMSLHYGKSPYEREKLQQLLKDYNLI